MKYIYFLACLLWLPFGGQAQDKILDHDDFEKWRRIRDRSISYDGNYISYYLKSNAEANDIVTLKDTKGTTLLTYERGTKPKFSYDANYLFFTIKHDIASLKALKRKKVKKADLPQDSLAIYHIQSKKLVKIPQVKSLKVPEKWNDWLVYQHDPADSTKKKKVQKGKEKIYPLVIQKSDGSAKMEFPNVLSYELSEKGSKIAFITKGDSTILAGVYVVDVMKQEVKPAFRAKGKYYSLSWDEMGDQLAFVSDLDTTKALLRKPNLHLLTDKSDSATVIIAADHTVLKTEWLISEHYENSFSKDGSKLYFGMKTYPILPDTTVLDEDKVMVEVWSYQDQRLHTQQKIEKSDDEKKAYDVVYNISNQNITLFARDGQLMNQVAFTPYRNHKNALGIDNLSYRNLASWEGYPYYNDLYALDVTTGAATLIKKKVRGRARMSPNGAYAFWYDNADSAWFTYAFASQKVHQITTNEGHAFYNELHDTPSHPRSYGIAAWAEKDAKILIYDRWDIWEVDPENATSMRRITPDGREKQVRYRYEQLEEEEIAVKKGQKLLLTGFVHADKSGLIYELKYTAGASPKVLQKGNYRYRNFKKAQGADQMMFTQENFQLFPDILATDASFKNPTKISDANPQQAEYAWGSIELYSFTSLDGKELTGLLVKPPNFDPTKKYPMLVNFYEKNSDRLNYHRDPYPERSSINYSFYASRGYVIFNPDIYYKDGYPGQSAYNCVIPGITSLIKEGFIDRDRIGVQGHSWGGYQVAHLVTKTDIFKCAESGAPVPNMISAYGGIRWWTGLSRMFQYEHTQSRIGGSLWEYPERYIENSPIFNIDKINTPVLIMHNDADGHVPWYQGIEFFVAMRRLGKPSWFLNYQGEPHWPVKLRNRIDFNKRMQQYFDYYLMNTPMPKWMKEGVPAIKVGVEQGFGVGSSIF